MQVSKQPRPLRSIPIIAIPRSQHAQKRTFPVLLITKQRNLHIPNNLLQLRSHNLNRKSMTHVPLPHFDYSHSSCNTLRQKVHHTHILSQTFVFETDYMAFILNAYLVESTAIAYF